MYGYIYRITDLTNGKCYIGQHKYDKPMLDPKYHGSSHILKNQIKKHPENFLEELLMICASIDELNYFETYFIEHLNTLYPNGYNLNTGGDVRKGGKRSIETRQKMSDAQKGKHVSEETRKKLRDYNKGKKLSPEHKQKIGASNKGKHRTDEWKQEMSEIKKGKKHSEEWIQNRTSFKIDKDTLFKLYVEDDLTINQISELYGCSWTCIYNKLQKFHIKTLPSKKQGINSKMVCPLLIYKYLIIDKMSKTKICEILNISFSTLQSKIKKYNFIK